MTEAQLTWYASWASIISLFISLFSLLYLRSIKHNIIRLRRKQRVWELLEDVLTISSENMDESSEKLFALRRNLPVRPWSRFTARGRVVIELHAALFDEILNLTRQGRLSWRQIGRKDHAAIILNPHLVIRQFSTSYQRDEDAFTVLLLERRYLYNEETSFMERLEGRRAELLILEKGELIVSLRELAVKLARMMELLDLVIDQRNLERRLIGAPN